ncbi:heterokaryon incompatibility protein-domain-containing protein [Fusarium redolens]|uniref:Heterokaryon incompatibility protein-domain-containing protein n=1 Tax=Fusarium redolens TaxID=48865 RepID=A0A9P9JU15_FUSRE|nr:heterokaryon incompatibility protein-domain-containing protein [Fusarium redolens]KAH7237807.1 heterokaryon incompatibility protein-domain-containing protein [Fusarium redolens]
MPLAHREKNAGVDCGYSPYEYTPLSAGQIRLLRLHAGQEADQLNGELIVKNFEELPPRPKAGTSALTEPIDPEKYVCFDAISYVWGQSAFADSFFTPQGSIPITASLASILRRLRDEKKSQLYWADGLCINQSDIAEKEVQVSLMGIIYSSAMRVLCDIGEETENIALVLEAIERYWKRNIRHGFVMGQGDSMILSGESTAKLMGIPYPTDEEADSIEDVEGEEWPKRYLELISAPWFHRLWVVQEFVLGRDVVMVIGRRHIPWGQLWAGTVWYKGVDWPWDSAEYTNEDLTSLFMSFNAMCLVRSCRLIDLDTPHGREFNDTVKLLLCGVEMNQANLPMCMVFFCSHGCTVPRDRYFGILGMVDEEDQEKALSLRPDYTSPMSDITMRFWRYALQTGSGGELMLCAGLPGLTEGYPSWIRDLSAPKPLNHIWIGAPLSTAWHAAGGPASTWSIAFSNEDPDQAFVQGYHIDDISDRSPTGASDPFNFVSMTRWIEEAFNFFTGSESSDGDSNRLYPLNTDPVREAALKVVMDYNKQDTMSPDDEEFEAMLRIGLSLPLAAFSEDAEEDTILEKIVSEFEDEDEILTLQELFLRVHKTRGLGYYKTGKGLFALLPKGVCVGDSVWILKGCRLPVVLRPSISHHGPYEFVGGGYVYGVMNGEMLEKPGFEWQKVSLR